MECEVFVNRQRHPGLWSAENTLLRHALMISLAVHGLAFFPAMTHPERPVMTLPLRVRMAVPMPVIEDPAPRPALITTKASNWQATTAPAREQKPATAQPAVLKAMPRPTEPPLPATTVFEPREGELEADALRGFRLEVGAGVWRKYSAGFERYPFGGQVVIGVIIGAAGAQVRVSRSSGERLLDEAAREWVAAVVAQTPIPAALRARSFDIELPFSFSPPKQNAVSDSAQHGSR